MVLRTEFMKPPKHPLRTLRALTPHRTQAAFAALLDVPVAVIQSVESGRARPTPRLAARVKEMTGADDVELLRGADGQVLTLSGKRYTEAAWTAWQGSAAQQAEQRRREGQAELHRTMWSRHDRRARQWMEAAPQPAGERDFLEAAIQPWQICEFHSAAAKDWRKAGEAVQQSCGWSRDLPAAAALQRLTLSVQHVPEWNPSGAPPGIAAGNAELFPPCCFTVAAGSAGCRAAGAFWAAVCREHGIDAQTGRPAVDSPTGNWRGFFREREGRCEPHAVLAGLEPEERQEVLPDLFAPGSVLTAGADLSTAAMDFIEAHSADAGSPAGILIFASLEGATASTLSSRLLEKLRARFPTVPLLVIGVLPLAGVSPVVHAPWHTAMALHAVRRYASAALLFSNDLLIHHAAKAWRMASPGYGEANLLMAECLAALTAPLRFGGSDTQPVDLAALLECFAVPPDAGFTAFTALCWPLVEVLDRRVKSVRLPAAMRAASAVAEEAKFLGGDTAALAMLLRTRLKPGDEWAAEARPPEITLRQHYAPGAHESLTLAGSHPAIRRTLRRLGRHALEVWKMPGALRACVDLGMDPGFLQSAIRELAAS